MVGVASLQGRVVEAAPAPPTANLLVVVPGLAAPGPPPPQQARRLPGDGRARVAGDDRRPPLAAGWRVGPGRPAAAARWPRTARMGGRRWWGGAAAAGGPPVAGYLFRREGEYWAIGFEGVVVRLRDAKGLGHLARLLAHPGREFHAVEWRGPAASQDPGRRRGAWGVGVGWASLGCGPIWAMPGCWLDATAKAAYRARLVELGAEVEAAEANNDPARATRARAEREFLVAELARAVGLGGRDRRAAAHAERARLNVTRAIRAAMANLARANPALGRHLAVTIRTGRYCAYTPTPGPRSPGSADPGVHGDGIRPRLRIAGARCPQNLARSVQQERVSGMKQRADGRAGRQRQEAGGHGNGSTAARAEHGRSTSSPPTTRRPGKRNTQFLGVEPYFERPGCVEFRIGDYQAELGIIDSNDVPGTQSHEGRAGVVVYWHVDDVDRPCSPRLSAWAPPSSRRPRTAAKASSPPPRSTRSATSSGSCTTPITSRSCRRSSQPEPGRGEPSTTPNPSTAPMSGNAKDRPGTCTGSSRKEHPVTSTPQDGAQQPPTLFAWAGGAEAWSRLTRIF